MLRTVNDSTVRGTSNVGQINGLRCSQYHTVGLLSHEL